MPAPIVAGNVLVPEEPLPRMSRFGRFREWGNVLLETHEKNPVPLLWRPIVSGVHLDNDDPIGSLGLTLAQSLEMVLAVFIGALQDVRCS